MNAAYSHANEMLRITDLHAFYGESHILHGIDPVSYTHLTLPTSDLV